DTERFSNFSLPHGNSPPATGLPSCQLIPVGPAKTAPPESVSSTALAPVHFDNNLLKRPSHILSAFISRLGIHFHCALRHRPQFLRDVVSVHIPVGIGPVSDSLPQLGNGQCG